jgi:hypothetical protein
MHFIVALLVNVAAATNFHGSGEPQDATTTVGAQLMFLPRWLVLLYSLLLL